MDNLKLQSHDTGKFTQQFRVVFQDLACLSRQFVPHGMDFGMLTLPLSIYPVGIPGPPVRQFFREQPGMPLDCIQHSIFTVSHTKV